MEAQTAGVRVRSVLTVGSRALLAELAGPREVLALTAALRNAPLPGQEGVLPGAGTVLITAHSPPALRPLRRALLNLEVPTSEQAAAGKEVVIDTVYDGEDLSNVAALTGRSVEQVVALHSGQVWKAAFGGFAPGFSYLLGDGRLDVPRLPSPRTAVPPGSVALAGSYSAVYPRTSPGGWQLIGRTDAVLWDLDRGFPALVSSGDTVRFRPVRELIGLKAQPLSASPQELKAGSPRGGLRILSPGALSLVEDQGRPGHEDQGVPVSGALDRASLRRANRLVGNAAGAACIETVAGGLVLQAVGDQIVAVTGAPVPLQVGQGGDATTPGAGRSRVAFVAEPIVLLDGDSLRLGSPTAGFRSYVSVRGGIDVEPVLGSRSTDTLSGIGPAALTAMQVLAVGADAVSGVVGSPELQPDYPTAGETTDLRLIAGPRDDWFEDGALELLCSQTWTVSSQSNRVALRLAGSPLPGRRTGELPSEGMVTGAIQVPPDGHPLLFLADHPVTGGYPVIAVVTEEDLQRAAQVPLGGLLRFRLLRQ